MYRLTLTILTASVALADVRVKSRITAGGQTTETAVYTKGARQRMEYGKEAVILQQCDLKRMIQINEAAKSYFIVPMDGAPASTAPKKGGVVTLNTTLNDTGERKQMFGLEARRIKSTVARTPSAESCDQSKERIETDGWYVDLDVSLSCPLVDSSAAAAGCSDEIRTQVVGSAKLGYPVAYTMTTTGNDGKANVVSMEVAELSRETLAAALFEPPVGFRQQGSAREMLAAAPKTGPVRVGIPPVVDRSGRVTPGGMDGTLMHGLAEAKIDAVPLPGGTPEEIQNHARQAQCDYVLVSEIGEVKKPSGKKLGGLMARASGLINQKEAIEARVDYRLIKTADASPLMSSSATGKTGGSSFNVMGAVNLAFTVANVMTMQSMLGGGMFNSNLINSLMQMKSAGMSGGGMAGIGGMDPALGGMQFMMQQNPFAGAPTTGSENQAVTAALGETAKAVVAQLKRAQ